MKISKIILTLITLMLSFLIFSGCANNSETEIIGGSLTDISNSKDVASDLTTVELNDDDCGGFIECPVHHDSFHTITYSLMTHVGEDKFYDWVEKSEKEFNNAKKADNGCIFSVDIFSFIEYFDVKKEVIDSLCNETNSYYNTDYPTDILYSGSREVIEQYYSDFDACEKRMRYKEAVGMLKYNIREALPKNLKYDIDLRKTSIDELIKITDSSQENVNFILNQIEQQVKIELQVDMDAIFNNSSISKDSSAIEKDEYIFRNNN